jgi:Ca2+/Na+ antiporter
MKTPTSIKVIAILLIIGSVLGMISTLMYRNDPQLIALYTQMNISMTTAMILEIGTSLSGLVSGIAFLKA